MIRKEWYKFREIFIVFTVLVLCFTIYIAFKSYSSGHEAYLENLIFIYEKGFTFFHITDLNLVFAFFMGVSVFLRERIFGRLRISLHFPNHIFVNISYIVGVGLIFLVLVYIIEFVAINNIYSYYTDEIMSVINFTLMLNFAFGMVCYLMCGCVIIEPLKINAGVNFAMFLAFLLIYYELNPDIYEINSFYYNELGFYYFLCALIYAISAIFVAFRNYKIGYIR